MTKISQSVIDECQFITPPECQGQLVEVSYAGAAELGIIRRVRDRSVGEISYAVQDWEDSDYADEDSIFDPWNSEPGGEFEAVEVV